LIVLTGMRLLARADRTLDEMRAPTEHALMPPPHAPFGRPLADPEQGRGGAGAPTPTGAGGGGGRAPTGAGGGGGRAPTGAGGHGFGGGGGFGAFEPVGGGSPL